MKYIFSEFTATYSQYEFPYQIYVFREESDKLEDIYSKGALPTRIDARLFYVARGVRVDLTKFSPNSENRRITRKTSNLQLKIVPLDMFDYQPHIGKLAKDFYDTKFGKGTLSAQKAKWLFRSGAYSHVIVYKDIQQNSIIGYCIVNLTDNIMHYAYPFYRLELINTNTGIGMMTSAIMNASGSDLDLVYLGTCYDQRAKYKLQFKGIEYFNGWEWSEDIDALKSLLNSKHDSHLLSTPGKRTNLIEHLTGTP